MARRARAALLQQSAAQGLSAECGAPDGVARFFAASDGAAGTAPPTDGGEPQDTELGNAALRSPLRTRSVEGGNADLPAESASRRSIEAARPPDARTASGEGFVAAGGAAELAAPTKLRDPLGGEPGVGTVGVDDAAVGSAAVRSPLRTRSAAGGRAVLPADRARRRSIEAARPEISLKAGMARPEALSEIPRDTR
jgi:hypothetical protein